MNDLLLNDKHDTYLKGEQIARIAPNGKESVRKATEQGCLCLLKTEEGESFIDYTHGIPWFDKILGLPVQYLDAAAKIIKEKLLEVAGVAKVVKLDLNVKGRNLSGNFKVKSEDGIITTGGF